MGKAKINGKTINFDKIVYKNKSVNDFINDLEPNINGIIRYAKINGNKPFNGNSNRLKQWLIDNQQGYNKYVPDIFYYFKDRCKI
jgi:hypothetical protein